MIPTSMLFLLKGKRRRRGAAAACDGDTNANLINISSQRRVVLSGEGFFFSLQVRLSSEGFLACTLGLAVAPRVALACTGDSPQR